MDPNALRAITDVGTVGLLILVLVGGFRGWWVYGPMHDRITNDLVADRNFWRDMALRGVTLAERAADAALTDLAAHAAEREQHDE